MMMMMVGRARSGEEEQVFTRESASDTMAWQAIYPMEEKVR